MLLLCQFYTLVLRYRCFAGKYHVKNALVMFLTGSGVSTDIWTSYAARIMGISVIPFMIILVFYTITQSQVVILASFIVSICLLLSYCLYQVQNLGTCLNFWTSKEHVVSCDWDSWTSINLLFCPLLWNIHAGFPAEDSEEKNCICHAQACNVGNYETIEITCNRKTCY